MEHDECRCHIGSRPALRRAARPEPGIFPPPPAPQSSAYVFGCVFRVGEACWEHGFAFPPHARPCSEQAPVLPESAQLRRTPRESESSHRDRTVIGGNWAAEGNENMPLLPPLGCLCCSRLLALRGLATLACLSAFSRAGFSVSLTC